MIACMNDGRSLLTMVDSIATCMSASAQMAKETEAQADEESCDEGVLEREMDPNEVYCDRMTDGDMPIFPELEFEPNWPARVDASFANESSVP